MKSADFRCYTSETKATAQTINVAAGSQLGIAANGNIYHAGVVNVYMARASNGDASTFAGDGNVWFKVHEIPAKTDGGSTITFPGSSASFSLSLHHASASLYSESIPLSASLLIFVAYRYPQCHIHRPEVAAERPVPRPYGGYCFALRVCRWWRSVAQFLLRNAVTHMFATFHSTILHQLWPDQRYWGRKWQPWSPRRDPRCLQWQRTRNRDQHLLA